MVLISDTIICNKDFSERNVKNFVAETEKLNSLIYIKAEKDEKQINAKYSSAILNLKLKQSDKFKIILFNCFKEEMQPDLDKVLEVINDFKKK